MTKKSLLLILALILSGAPHCIAQDPTPTPLRFEVVSIRPSNPREQRGTLDIQPDGFVERNNTLSWLIVYAYGATIEGTVENEPAWAENERFDLEAKVAPEDVGRFQALSREQKANMLKPVLRDRCQLRLHTRVKEIHVYYLEIVKSGSKLVESKPDAAGKTPKVMQARSDEFLGGGVTIDEMIGNISYFARRPVLNHTALKGKYEFDLKWSEPETSSGSADDPAIAGPSFFTALSEQLGLKLVPAVAPFDAIVIDNLERPTPN